MENVKNPYVRILKLTSCAAIDIAVILTFFKTLGLFLIIAPNKSIVALTILIIGIILSNCAILIPDMIFKIIGISYTISIITILIAYSFIANVFSIILRSSSTISYIAWEFMLFGVFALILAIVISFSRNSAVQTQRNNIEFQQNELIKQKLIEIETAFDEKDDKESLKDCIASFKTLKERIRMSTPFGRIVDNAFVLDSERQIQDNLSLITSMLKSDKWVNTLPELNKLIASTRKLVINRENLNIK